MAIFLAKLGYAGLSVDLYKSTEVYPRGTWEIVLVVNIADNLLLLWI